MDTLLGNEEGGDFHHMEIDRTTTNRKQKTSDADGKKSSSKLAR